MSSRLAVLGVLIAAGVLPAARAASPVFISPDVATDETASTSTILPWEMSRYDASGPTYKLAFVVPGNAPVDAIHKLDEPGDWLFSVESVSDLGGVLVVDGGDPRDVIRYDGSGGVYTLFFCGAGVADPIPAGTNVDALYLEGGDGGDLIVSFDVPTTIGTSTFDPADLVRYERTAGGTCNDWALSDSNPAFDASAAGSGIGLHANVTGADATAGTVILSFDVPTDVGPPGLVTYIPGQLVAWDGAEFSSFESLSGWPISSEIDGVSCLANPGRVPPTISVEKSVISLGELTISWNPSCSDGGADFRIYEGTLPSFDTHTAIACTDVGSDETEEIAPAAGNTYYLVVPENSKEEGSYGTESEGDERPQGSPASCSALPQEKAPCPA